MISHQKFCHRKRTTVFAALLVCAAAMLPQRAWSAALEASGHVPKGVLAVVSVENPASAVLRAVMFVESAAAKDASVSRGWTAFQKEMKDKLGIEKGDLTGLAKSGIDLSRPFILAVPSGLAKDGVPSHVVFSIGVTDDKLALETLRKLAVDPAKLVDVPGTPAVLAYEKSSAVCIKDKRLYGLGATGVGEEPAKLAELLRAFITDSESTPLAAQENFKTAAEALPPLVEESVYINVAALLEVFPALPDRPSQYADVQAVTVAHASDSVISYTALKKDSARLKYLETGGVCADFLARMDHPLAALTVSLADPEPFGKNWTSADGKGNEVDSAEAALKEELGLDPAAVVAQLKNGAGGAAFYATATKPGGEAGMGFIGFAKLADRAKALELFDHATWKTVKPERKAINDNVIWTIEGSAMGIVADYFVFGDDVARISSLAAGKGGGWKPRVGGKEIMDFELDLDGAVKQFGAILPPEAQKSIRERVDPQAVLRAKMSRHGDGLLVNLDWSGIKAESLLPELLFGFFGPQVSATEPKKSASEKPEAPAVTPPATPAEKPHSIPANEANAITECRAYVKAQEKFHETDWNNDGIKKYAQRLHELFHPNKDDASVKLIDGGFKNAEEGPTAKPKMGYLFRVLKADARKGSYIAEKHMTKGFALIAYPAEYGVSGKETFVVDESGVVMKKDLGADTAEHVQKIKAYPDTTADHWKKAE